MQIEREGFRRFGLKPSLLLIERFVRLVANDGDVDWERLSWQRRRYRHLDRGWRALAQIFSWANWRRFAQ